MYPCVKNVHLKTVIDLGQIGGGESQLHSVDAVTSLCSIRYLREIETGPCDMKSGYGLIMAENCGFPTSVMTDARLIRKSVRNIYPFLAQQWQVTDESEKFGGAFAVKVTLDHLKLLESSTLSIEGLRSYLYNLRKRIPSCSANEMISYLRKLGTDGSGGGLQHEVATPTQTSENEHCTTTTTTTAVRERYRSFFRNDSGQAEKNDEVTAVLQKSICNDDSCEIELTCTADALEFGVECTNLSNQFDE